MNDLTKPFYPKLEAVTKDEVLMSIEEAMRDGAFLGVKNPHQDKLTDELMQKFVDDINSITKEALQNHSLVVSAAFDLATARATEVLEELAKKIQGD